MIIENDEIFQLPYFKNPDCALIYAPLRGILLLVKKRDANLLFLPQESPEKREIIDFIKKNKIIDLNKILNQISSDVPDLSISLTNGCNLKCVYCFAQAGKNPIKVVSKNEIDQILNFYFSVIDKKYPSAKYSSIGFLGGGEPTTQPGLLFYVVEKAKKMSKERGKETRIGTSINGCINRKIAEYIMREFSYISLSFNGPDFIQNTHRPYKNGQGTFNQVFNTSKLFYANNFDFAFRATISKLTLKYYKEFIDFFSTHFPGASLGIEPLYPMGRGEASKIAPTEEEFFAGMKEMIEYAKNKPILLSNSDCEMYDTIRPYYCSSVAIPNICVTPYGLIYACAKENEEFYYGKFNFSEGTVNIDYNKIKKIQSNKVENFLECRDCACKYHCSGDCPDNRKAGLLIKCKSILSSFEIAINDFYNNGSQLV